MNFFTIHPDVYSTDETLGNLPDLLDKMWLDQNVDSKSTLVVISGFANYNGGVRFFDFFENHIKNGGQVITILGASSSQRLSSTQVVKELVNRGAKVKLVNRKKLLHSKMYGCFSEDSDHQSLVISSGNFTGPGMALNVESSFLADSATLSDMDFSWTDLLENIEKQGWQIFDVFRSYDETQPYNNLLYDEEKYVKSKTSELDIPETEYLITTLSHNDTSRIVQRKNGTQYIWLSKNVMGYFPPLLIRNSRGIKKTYSAELELSYPQLNQTGLKGRVTFEADNNLDFRFLTTAKVYGTNVAKENDLAVIKNTGDNNYEVIFVKEGTPEYIALSSYATDYIGNRGKRYGFIEKSTYDTIVKNNEKNLSNDRA